MTARPLNNLSLFFDHSSDSITSLQKKESAQTNSHKMVQLTPFFSTKQEVAITLKNQNIGIEDQNTVININHQLNIITYYTPNTSADKII